MNKNYHALSAEEQIEALRKRLNLVAEREEVKHPFKIVIVLQLSAAMQRHGEVIKNIRDCSVSKETLPIRQALVEEERALNKAMADYFALLK